MGAFAKKHLEGKKVILHTDSARSYKIKFPGVIHDAVVHQKKRVMIDGKARWIKPRFTKVFKHRLPTGRRLTVKGGTQTIDRAWRFLKECLGSRSGRPGSAQLTSRIRSAQWCYWHRDDDLLEETGRLLRELRGKRRDWWWIR